MGHSQRSFAQFFTDMRGVDAWQTVLAKIFLIIEMLWTLVAVSFLLVNYYMKTYSPFPAQDELSAFLLVIAHLGASITLVSLVKKLQKGHAPVWFDAWWLVLCICLDIRAILESRQGSFSAPETADYLLGMGIVAVILSSATMVLFILAKNIDIHQKVEHTMAHHSGTGGEEQHTDIESVEGPKSQIGSSMPGVVSMRFTGGSSVTKFVHQPARKAE
jgi:hypothetical protein